MEGSFSAAHCTATPSMSSQPHASQMDLEKSFQVAATIHPEWCSSVPQVKLCLRGRRPLPIEHFPSRALGRVIASGCSCGVGAGRGRQALPRRGGLAPSDPNRTQNRFRCLSCGQGCSLQEHAWPEEAKAKTQRTRPRTRSSRSTVEGKNAPEHGVVPDGARGQRERRTPLPA